MNGNIHSIVKGGTVDGPGTRYVIFVKGCPMRCLYCHNPDTWTPVGGTEMTVDEILKDYDSIAPFLANGGITVTGGEPLTQIDFLLELFEKAKKKGIHTCLDTSGIMFRRNVPEIYAKYEKLASLTDLVLLDIKHIDPEGHKALTAQPIDNILDFLHFLDEKDVKVWIRHVIVPDITFKEELLVRLGTYIAQFHNVKGLDILPYHDMAKKKYKEMGMDYVLADTKPLETSDGQWARDVILKAMKVERDKLRAEGKYIDR